MGQPERTGVSAGPLAALRQMSDLERKLGRATLTGRPPFSFFACAVAIAVVFCGSLLHSAACVAATAADGYRLAGTLAVGQDYVAFLEVPEGGQVLVRAGSIVNGAKVLSVSADAVRLSMGSGVFELSLAGSGKPRAVASAAIVSASDDDKNRVYNREVSGDQLSRELAAPAQASAGSTPGKAVVDGQRIAAVLDLPAGSRVLRVQAQPVSSAAGAISQLQSAFAAQDGIVILDIQTPTGPGRVYLKREKH
jgi:hypothetical protein